MRSGAKKPRFYSYYDGHDPPAQSYGHSQILVAGVDDQDVQALLIKSSAKALCTNGPLKLYMTVFEHPLKTTRTP